MYQLHLLRCLYAKQVINEGGLFYIYHVHVIRRTSANKYDVC